MRRPCGSQWMRPWGNQLYSGGRTAQIRPWWPLQGALLKAAIKSSWISAAQSVGREISCCLHYFSTKKARNFQHKTGSFKTDQHKCTMNRYGYSAHNHTTKKKWVKYSTRLEYLCPKLNSQALIAFSLQQTTKATKQRTRVHDKFLFFLRSHLWKTEQLETHIYASNY